MIDVLGAGTGAAEAYGIAVDRLIWIRADLQNEVVRHSTMSPAQAAECVEQLLSCGALRVADDGSGVLSVRPPASVFRAHLADRREELARIQDELETRVQRLDALQQRWLAADDVQASEVLQKIMGVDAARARLEDIASGTRYEWLSLFPAEGPAETGFANRLAMDRDLINRDVAVRKVVIRSAAHHGAESYPRLLSAAGAEVRTVPVLSTHMAISDRSTAVLLTEPDDTWRGVVVVRTPLIVAALFSLFERVWTSATPVDTPAAVGPDGFDDVTNEIVRVLASGATDDAVSHHLGVSTRTVRRAIAALMADLGVGSRFELGLELGRRGWTADTLPRLPARRL